MKNGRLFELLYLLVERRALTAGELAERFEVSERTIYRDVDALSAAGVPVYTQRGQGGGIRLMDQFVLDRCLLSPREQDEVLFALRALLSTGGLEGAEALERLSALFRREAEGWVEVDFTDWGSGEQERENFRIVREGILGRRLLDFTYYASSGTRTRRRVEPGKLVFKSGCWYLQAFCLARRDWRIFRLARMEGLCLEWEGFPPRRPPEQLEVPSPEQRQNGTLTLRLAPSAAWRVRDYFAPGQIWAGEDGCLLVECDFPQDGWLLGFLLSFGDQVEVLAPASWREVLSRTGKKIAALYETGHSVSGIQAYPEGTEEGSTPPEQKEEPDMEERIFCQCCGMPLDAPEDMGSNADGSPNRDYCCWCYQRGAFTAPEATVEDMIAFDLKFNEENGHPFGPQEEAERLLRAWLPTLKRWRK